jgi:lipoyl synthase
VICCFYSFNNQDIIVVRCLFNSILDRIYKRLIYIYFLHVKQFIKYSDFYNMINNKEDKSKLKKVRPRLPEWIRVKAYTGQGRNDVNKLVSSLGLNTVCQSAKCPNIGECWHKKTATFMIMGNTCTRNCKFCAVDHGETEPLDKTEPLKLAEAVKEMKLKYVVITSVTRDDLDDGGAQHFTDVINTIRELNSNNIALEVLTPDFKGNADDLKKVLSARPTVFNHNIETVERLSEEIRVIASYDRSLDVLNKAAQLSNGEIAIKSGLMVGLGEKDQEVVKTIDDLFLAGVRMLTIGQYLPPTIEHWPLDRYVHPDKFEEWKEYSYAKGFTHVASAPLVRSSYHAEDLKNFQSNL